MKKVTLVLAMLMIGLTASAQDQWSYWYHGATRTAPILAIQEPLEPGIGVGWYVALMNGATEVASKSVLANNAGNLYIAAGNFGVGALVTELDTDVFLRIYNNVAKGSASLQIDSAFVTLKDATAPLGTTAVDAPVSFTGSTWQAIPEPATFMLFGIGGFGAWLIRRKNRVSKED